LRIVGRAPACRRSIDAGRECGRGAQFAKCGEAVSSDSLHKILGQLLCLLGFHDYHAFDLNTDRAKNQAAMKGG
jgi:hypothetical protein